MITRHFLLTTSFSLLLAAAPAFSQGPSGNMFRDSAREMIKGEMKNPYNLDPTNQNGNIDDLRGKMMPCVDGNCGAAGNITDDAQMLGELSPGTSKRSANVYAPMAGFTDTMFSQAYVNMMSKSLASPMALYNITLLMTEPGVAGGLNSAALQSYNSVTNRYLAEQHLNTQFDANPETAEILKRAYVECVANSIRLRPPHGNPQGGAQFDEASWIEAQSRCMGDRIDSLASLGSGGANFEMINRPNKKVGFDLGFDRSSDYWHTGQNGDTAAYQSIRLTDYLFNEATDRASSHQQNDSGLLDYGDIRAIKDDFYSLVGDYVFFLNSDSAQGERSASVELHYKREYPQSNVREWLSNRQHIVYNNIMEFVLRRCMFEASDGGTFCSPSVHTPDQFVDVSTRGFVFDCSLTEMIYREFEQVYPQIGDLNPKNSIARCQVLNPGGDSSLQTVLGSGNWAKPYDTVLYLSNQIATSQIYLTMMYVNSIVENMTNQVGSNHFIAKYASQLIYDVVGSGDLQERYRGMMADIRDKFLPAYRDLRAKESGKAVQKVKNMGGGAAAAVGAGN